MQKYDLTFAKCLPNDKKASKSLYVILWAWGKIWENAYFISGLVCVCVCVWCVGMIGVGGEGEKGKGRKKPSRREKRKSTAPKYLIAHDTTSM